MTHLPLAPTRTAFCSAEIPLWEGLSFFVDGNSKITAANGTYAAPKPNAFSLPAASVSGIAEHCPGSTRVCRESCYVRGLAKHAPDLYARYEQNAITLATILGAPTGRGWFHSALKLANWIADNAAGGFRWHVSGEVQSAVHAEWIATVCSLADTAPFWIYTRTLEHVPRLCLVPNLAVNVSADAENYADAWLAARTNGARITYLTQDGSIPIAMPRNSVIFPDYALRGRDLADPTTAPWWGTLTHEQRTMVCPADFFSQSSSNRCGVCTKCLVK